MPWHAEAGLIFRELTATKGENRYKKKAFGPTYTDTKCSELALKVGDLYSPEALSKKNLM